MVRFKVNYGAHISKKFVYIDYDRLKDVLHEDDADEKAAIPPLVHPTKSLMYSHLDFPTLFDEEIGKVESCYMTHMIDLDYAHVDVQRLAKEFTDNKDKSAKSMKWKKKAQEAALKRNVTTLYDKLVKLETYCLLNRTAAIKILKKHDKMAKKAEKEPIYETYMVKVNRTNFGSGQKLSAMKDQIEHMYADVFCHGIIEEAKGKLLLAKTHTDPRIQLAVTFKVGVVVTLLAWLINDFLVSPRLSLLYLTTNDPSVYVYAAIGALVIYRWFWGFSVFMWDSADIDYIFILDLDANKHMPSCVEIFSDAGNLAILYLINVIIFNALRYHHLHDSHHDASWDSAAGIIAFFSARAYVMPILLIFGTLCRMSYSFGQSSSYGVFSTKIFSHLFTTPLGAVQLRHTYAADILCSFTKVLSSVLYGGCYFVSGSYLYSSEPNESSTVDRFAVCNTSAVLQIVAVIIHLIPYCIRFLQCLRQRRDYFVRKKLDSVVHIAPPTSPKSTTGAANNKTGTSLATVQGSGREGGLRSRKASSENSPNSKSRSGAPTPQVSDDRDNELDRDEGEQEDEEKEGVHPLDDEDRDGHEDDDDVRPFRDIEEGVNGDGDGDGRKMGSCSSKDDEDDLPQEFHESSNRARQKPGSSKDKKRPMTLSRAESFDLPLPSLLRFTPSSCVPHVVVHVLQTIWVWPYSYNALRYFLNLCVISFGAYPPQDPLSVEFMAWYIPLYVISTLYSCYWDVANDFKLMQFSSSRPWLRDKIMYEDKEYFYYIVLVTNPILRFFWTLSFTPYGKHPFLVVFEIMRRSLWACLRMELGYIQELERRKK